MGWSRDSAAVYVQRGIEVPVRIERVDLATGERTLVRTLAPEGVAEPASVSVADWIDDGRAYAYNYTSVPSVLFVVSGVRRKALGIRQRRYGTSRGIAWRASAWNALSEKRKPKGSPS